MVKSNEKADSVTRHLVVFVFSIPGSTMLARAAPHNFDLSRAPDYQVSALRTAHDGGFLYRPAELPCPIDASVSKLITPG